MPALDYTPLKNALHQLEIGIEEAEGNPSSELLRDGVIQRFEYSHELALRMIKRALEMMFGESVDTMLYNDVLRSAAEHGLITDVEQWFEYRKQRNKTSHIYDEEVAMEVYSFAKPFLAHGHILLERLYVLKYSSDA